MLVCKGIDLIGLEGISANVTMFPLPERHGSMHWAMLGVGMLREGYY
jgi:hypothetical protein